MSSDVEFRLPPGLLRTQRAAHLVQRDETRAPVRRWLVLFTGEDPEAPLGWTK